MTIETSNRYDFIVTGASGNVGRHIIPILARRGSKVLAVGRDASGLGAQFSGVSNVDVIDYDSLSRHAACDTMVHLAVRNNNQPGSLDDFTKVNVGFGTWVCEQFNRMGGKRFVNISSVQSLDDDNASPYAVSKRMARRRIAELVGARLDNVYIGYFYDEGYFGEKLAILNRAGGALGGALFGFFKTLKPATSARSLADYLSDPGHALPAPGILADDLSRSLVYRTATRTLDIAVAIAILIVLLPVLLVLSVLIRLDSPGPVIFAQKRVGKAQAPFTLYKFRTMKRDTASAGTHEVSASAVTKIGKFLRGTKLDELPQAINLLRGEMTLVGPRPCLPTQEELVKAREALGIFAMKPGITGYSQIREIDMSRPHELARSDYLYMKLQSLTLNFKILLLTAFGRGGGDRVAAPEKL